jgi:hypothetical protein
VSNLLPDKVFKAREVKPAGTGQIVLLHGKVVKFMICEYGLMLVAALPQ